ncbi:MAG: branched-chain amino acid ABC transporter ATP-binding protein/permease [Actinomycetota bacterium]
MKLRRSALVALALIVAPVLLGRVAPGVLNNERSTILALALVMAIGALSLNVLMGYTGQISLGHAAFMGVGAFATGLITGKAGLSFALGLAVSAIAGAAFAFLVGLPALRIRGLSLAISTIAFAEMMARLVFPARAISGGHVGLTVPRPRFGSFVVARNSDYLALVIALVIVVWIIDRNVTGTRLGRALHGIREDENVAASFGVDVPRFKLTAFVLAGTLAGVAGALHAPLLSLAQSEAYTLQLSLQFVIIVVVGGLGSRVGVMVAAIFFGVLPEVFGFLQAWQFAVGAGLLVYTLARHPGGIAQALRESAERKRRPDEEDDTDRGLPDLPHVSVGRARPESPADGVLLRARDVSVRFGGLQALDGAEIAVRENSIAGLIGPNGAGKTTFFNVLSGFQPHERGRVEFLGRDVTALGPHRRAAMGVGRTFQLAGLARNLSVEENFLLAQHSLAGYGAIEAIVRSPRARREEAAMRRRAREALVALGFERYAERAVSTLSGGQQRLVELGCALVTGPSLLLLDEPSAGLSPAATESLAERLRTVRDEHGVTILLIEHHIPLVAAVCDEVTVFNLGTLLASGPTADVIGNPAVIAAYLGEDAAADEEAVK